MSERQRAWSRRSLRSGVWRWRFTILARGTIVLTLGAAAALLVVLVVAGTPEDAGYFDEGIAILVGIGVLSLFAEYLDSAVGMGYGTIMAPVLVLLGFEPAVVVPAVLASEAATGLLAGILHHRAANVDLGRGSRDRRIATIVTLPAAVVAAAAAGAATGLAVDAAEVAIAVVVILVGGFVLVGSRVLGAFSWWKVGGLGAVAAAAKGLTGTGFGPVTTVGQIGIGVQERNAIGITSVSEGVVSLAGFAAYAAIEGWPSGRLTAALLVGAILALPAAVWTVRLLPTRTIRGIVAGSAVFVGVLALIAVATG
jgi:uncharacterized membrane protein YfcA